MGGAWIFIFHFLIINQFIHFRTSISFNWSALNGRLLRVVDGGLCGVMADVIEEDSHAILGVFNGGQGLPNLGKGLFKV